jgi:hypothetical protein
VILQYIRVTVVSMETQNCLLFVLLPYTFLCQLCHKYRKLCNGKKPCFLCIVTLHMSLPTIRNKTRSSCKMSCIIIQYGQLFSFRQIFVKAPVSNVIKFRQVGPVLIYADRRIDRQTDGRRDVMKLSLFRYFCESAQ